jgi:integrase
LDPLRASPGKRYSWGFFQSQYSRKAACEAAGIGRKFFHDFRRTAARNLRLSGVSETVAMKLTGHKTRSRYDRYDIKDPRDIREALARKQEYLNSLPSNTNISEFKKAESK